MLQLIYEWIYIVAAFLTGVWLFRKLEASSGHAESGKQGVWQLVLFFALAGGAYIRFAGVGFGLPDQFHPDEIPKAQVITRMYESGSLNPHYFLHPTLLLYLTLFTNKMFHLFGIEGSFYETAFLAGRVVSATAGTATLYLIFLLGCRTSILAGSVSSMLLAFFPLHVTVSRYMKEDALLAFFVMLVLYLALLAKDTGKSFYVYLTGVAAGLACATKYTGILSLLFFWFLPLSSITHALLLAIAGFVCATPFSVLDYQEFLFGFMKERDHALRGHTESISAWSQLWLYHWVRSIRPGITDIGAFFFLASTGFLAASKRTLKYIFFFTFFYCVAEYIPSKPAPQAERYVTLCLPFIALVMGEVIALLVSKKQAMLATIFFMAIFVPPCLKSYTLFRNLVPDTRENASRWIAENIPAGSTIVTDFQPYSPWLPEGRFSILNDPFLPVGPYIDVSKLQSMGAQYLILSSLAYDRFFSQPNQAVVERVKYRKIFERLPLLKEFRNDDGRYGFHNPIIRIYNVDLPLHKKSK